MNHFFVFSQKIVRKASKEGKITEIIEETWSTKKMWKKLCRGQRMITEL